MARKESKRRRRDDDDDEDRVPRRKKPKGGGVPLGLVIGLCAGGGFLVLVVIGVILVAVFWNRGGAAGGPGGGLAQKPGWTKTVSIDSGKSFVDRICWEEGKQHKIVVESDVTDPQTEIEILVYVPPWREDRTNFIARAKARGKHCAVNFPSPGFGECPFIIRNHGPGNAKCTITHDGLKNMNWQ